MNLLKLLPNCKVYSTVSQAEDESAWLAARTRGIGGSDIGPICGVSPFSSARQVYLSKTGQYTEAMKPGAAAQERMRFGHLLEPVVADEYLYRKTKELEDAVFPIKLKDGIKALHTLDATVSSVDHAWALANVDRIIEYNDGSLGILECKTTSEYGKDDWEEGDLMLTYIYQIQWYMFVTGLKRGAIACLVGGNKFYHYDIFYNEELVLNELFPKALNFWHNHVLKLQEPPLQHTDSDLVNNTYSTVIKNSEITLDSDVANDLAASVKECKLKIKELEVIMEEAQNRLKEMLQDNEIGLTQDYIIKWSPRSQKRVDSALLKNNYPEIYEICSKQISFRAMTIKGGLV